MQDAVIVSAVRTAVGKAPKGTLSVMNLDPTRTGIYIVDFNVAYHPYCYYNAEYDCPFPPAENRLTIPVRAGERLRKADTTVPR